MKVKESRSKRYQRIANISSIAMVVFLSAVFIVEARLSGFEFNTGLAGLIMLAGLIVVIAAGRYTIDPFNLAFTIPIILFIFNAALMMLGGWNSSRFLLICLAIFGISCIYSNFYRSIGYIITHNILIGFLVFRGVPIVGHGASLVVISVSWAIYVFACIVMLLLTRSATVALNKAVEHQNSFTNLLATTENYFAMVDERNEVVYASKTLSKLAEVEEPTLVQGRPLIDLFPGRTLKLYAGKLLKDKYDYAEDWEFSHDGQKRYFKAASHSLPGHSGALISLYDMTYLAERDEIAAMKDSLKIGIFFMDQNYVIQDHYSRYLEEMLSQTGLFGKLFTDVISDSVTPPELEAIKDYFGMIIERTFDQDMLDDINPLNELHYINVETGDRKVFQCAFATVERGKGEVFILVTVYDITIRVELQKRLQEEEAKRQEEMAAVFELINVEPDVFTDFSEDMEHEFGSIDKILKDNSLSSHEALVKVYQSVHAIKSNAVILGLNIFGNKVHNLESKIKKMREQRDEVPFVEMLNLAVDIEKLSQERENFKVVIDKLQSYGGGSGGGGERQNVRVLIDSLVKTTSKAAEDMEKTIQFVASDIEAEAIEKGPRRVMKEVLMQLIRNSAVHGIETPDARKEKGKNETGTIKLSIKLVDGHVHMKLSDDGKGLDYEKIARTALQKNLIKKEDAQNKDILMKAIFSPGFSTADTESVHAGRGIGLNLVRDRIKEVNGTIKLRSETGKGIIFFVSIPIPKQHNKVAPKKEEAS
ncbi:MAG: hypothetical protein LBH44_12890 [Treponema sp.]|jgi:two-component system chemotaxis sensor kinase CheA|nr:hypothetical protein [Treponema sp.]